MKIIILTAVAVLAAGPAFAVSKIDLEKQAARIAAERNDPWHIKHLGPVSLPPAIITDGTPLGEVAAPTNVGTVPEPASWALMLAGFGVVGGALRRRNMARVAA